MAHALSNMCCITPTMFWLSVLQAKLQRAEALSEERQMLTSHMRTTLLSNELKFKQVCCVGENRTENRHQGTQADCVLVSLGVCMHVTA